MHPGPINRGVELDSDVADSKQSIILQQVENGVAVRMAVLYLLAGKAGSTIEGIHHHYESLLIRLIFCNMNMTSAFSRHL